MSEFTFLDYEQVFGDKQLDIFKKYGPKAAITDFAILLGGFVSSDYYIIEGDARENRTGWWFTKTPYCDGNEYVISDYGYSSWLFANSRTSCVRPVLPYSLIQSISSSIVRDRYGIKEVEYGEYPQTIVDENYSCDLERAYNSGSLKITGKNYTTDSVSFQDTDTSFRARTHTEYEYNGSKYIRFVGDSNCNGEVLSDGRKIEIGNVYWVCVEPITWLVDEKANIALTKKLLFSGVQFKNKKDYKGDFDKTDIKFFMDNYFAKDIIPSLTEEEKLRDETSIKKQINPYNFKFNNVSEEDIIRGAIESGVAVFLHGPSSEGKSARVKQIDPTCEIIYLRNARPDSLNGKSVYNSNTG
ncbi:MAG: hypothetical protein IJI22_05475, partial [Bacilli bacterium]|nr:hypothetical protein [Bacilli bacterium]